MEVGSFYELIVKNMKTTYKMLSDLMNHIPDVIYFKDRDGRLVMVNKAHAKGLGLKPEDVIGKTDFDIFPKERASLMAKDDRYVIETGKPIIDKVERATRPDGIDNYVSTTKIPRYDADGKIIGLIGITRDITRRMQVERLKEEKEKIAEKLEVLEELNRMKSDFVSVVSHELRTPLTIIKEAVGLVSDGTAGGINDNQRSLLSKAHNNIERLRHMVDELLDISRIESERFRLHYSLVNLGDLLQDSMGFFKKMAGEKGVNLKYNIPRRQFNIFIDAERVNQVISNLITNAIKFTESGGKVRMEVKLLPDMIRIGVLDTGIGIAKADMPRLFNKFVQVSRVKAAEKKGVGLGLSIAKELVVKHGGSIWAESRLGAGSKFFFTLPRIYTTSVLSGDIRGRINYFLDNGIPVYLINLLIVNYHEFGRRIKIESVRLFRDIQNIIEEEGLETAVSDKENGEWSILLPKAAEQNALKLTKRLEDRIKKYFIKNRVKGVFINVGIIYSDQKDEFHTTQQVLANLHLKKIYIGSEIRRYRRINYKVDIEFVYPDNNTEGSHTIDISEGGVCFLCVRPLETDALVNIRLEVNKDIIRAKGRIAWIRPVEKGYKAGLEFINLKNRDKKILRSFLRRLSWTGE